MLTTPQRIVFVDTETTDIEPNRAVPWEIALVIRDPGMLDVEEVHLIHIDALRADPDALTVSRYYDRHPCAAAPINGHVCPLPPRYVTLAGVAEATAGAVMVGNVDGLVVPGSRGSVEMTAQYRQIVRDLKTGSASVDDPGDILGVQAFADTTVG